MEQSNIALIKVEGDLREKLDELISFPKQQQNNSSVISNGQGKRRKFNGVSRSENEPSSGGILNQQFGNVSSDGSVRLQIASQPELQHRARYQTEGSRGAIKDRSGMGHPTVRIEGYAAPATIEMYIGNDSGRIVPHMFYQACKVTGKNSNPCSEKKVEGTDVIEVGLEPGLEKVLVCDCVGILKERFADVEARFPKQKNWKTSKKKSTKCRLVFRTSIVNKNGAKETLQVASSVINCTQLPGTPEIIKINTSTSGVEGGGELWIIGRNFLKDTKVIFSYCVADKKEPLWSRTCDPEKEFIHQSHLITVIPPFFDLKIEEDVEVSVFVKCGDKISDARIFTYTPIPKQVAPALPKGVSAPAMAINDQYTKTGSVNLDKLVHNSSSSPQPTILEPIGHSQHRVKKCRLDYNGRSAISRRTRSAPRPKSVSQPNLINEDTMFMAEESSGGKENAVGANPTTTTTTSTAVTNFSQASILPWKDVVKTAPPTVANSTAANPASSFPPTSSPSEIEQTRNLYNQAFIAKRSFSTEIDEESQNCTVPHPLILEDGSRGPFTTTTTSRNLDISTNLTNDFSSVFSFNRGQQQQNCTTVTTSAIQNHQADQGYGYSEASKNTFTGFTSNTSLEQRSGSVDQTPVTSPPTTRNTMEEEVNKLEEDAAAYHQDVSPSSVSVQATKDEKATISISLPTSILKDKKHFQNVIETINKTLLKSPGSRQPDEADIASPAVVAAVSSPSMQELTSSPATNYSQQKTTPSSVQVSVLSKNRKRNFSSEDNSEILEDKSTWGREYEAAGIQAIVSSQEDRVTTEPAAGKSSSMDWSYTSSSREKGSEYRSNSMDWSTNSAAYGTQVKLSEVQSALGLQNYPGKEAHPGGGLVSTSDLPTTSMKGRDFEKSDALTHQHVVNSGEPAAVLLTSTTASQSHVVTPASLSLITSSANQVPGSTVNTAHFTSADNLGSYVLQGQQFNFHKPAFIQKQPGDRAAEEHHFLTNQSVQDQGAKQQQQQYVQAMDQQTYQATQPQQSGLEQAAAAPQVSLQYTTGNQLLTQEPAFKVITLDPPESTFSPPSSLHTEDGQQYDVVTVKQTEQFPPPPQQQPTKEQKPMEIGSMQIELSDQQLTGQQQQQYSFQPSQQYVDPSLQLPPATGQFSSQASQQYQSTPAATLQIVTTKPEYAASNVQQPGSNINAAAGNQPFTQKVVLINTSGGAPQTYTEGSKQPTTEQQVNPSNQFSNQHYLQVASFKSIPLEDISKPPTNAQYVEKSDTGGQYLVNGGQLDNVAVVTAAQSQASVAQVSSLQTYVDAQPSLSNNSSVISTAAAALTNGYEYKLKDQNTNISSDYSETFNQDSINMNNVGLAAAADNQAKASIVSSMDYEMSAPQSYSKPAAELALFDDPSVQIQGDPLLSETSAVIDAQKDIENAHVQAGSYIPQEQEWRSNSNSTEAISQWE